MPITSIKQILAQNLRYMRSELQLSQTEVAKAADITLRSYQSFESGISNPGLGTLISLGHALRTMPSRLISLERVRLQSSVEEFKKKYAEHTEDLDVACALRNHDAILLYRNKKFKKHFDPPGSEGESINLYHRLPPHGREILKVQLEAERKGIVTPYVNYSIDANTQEKQFLKLYPCLIYPPQGDTPVFAAVCSTYIEQDSRHLHQLFSNSLLKCI